MESLKRHWKRVPRAVRAPLVLMVGTFFLVLGLILIPLPGPGGLVIFLGLAILATEFAVAEKARVWILQQVQQWWGKIKAAIKKKT